MYTLIARRAAVAVVSCVFRAIQKNETILNAMIVIGKKGYRFLLQDIETRHQRPERKIRLLYNNVYYTSYCPLYECVLAVISF